MLAAIDAGSNTLRLLIGKVSDGRVIPEQYVRSISRLAGDFSAEKGLSPAAMDRTLSALKDFSDICAQAGLSRIAAVGTATFRMAANGHDFVDEIRHNMSLSTHGKFSDDRTPTYCGTRPAWTARISTRGNLCREQDRA